MSSSNCCFLTCIQVFQEAGQMVWYFHLLKNFPLFIGIHIVKGFGIVNKAKIDVLSVPPNSLCSREKILLLPYTGRCGTDYRGMLIEITFISSWRCWQTEISHIIPCDNVSVIALHCDLSVAFSFLAVQVFVSQNRWEVFWYQHCVLHIFPCAMVLCTKDSQIQAD